MRRILSVVALCVAGAVLAIRIHELRTPPEPISLAPRAEHLLYLDSLRAELLAFSEQYGKPVFLTDSVPPVTGHGRIQFGRLRRALLADPNIEYGYTDDGFVIEWRGDVRMRYPRFTHPPTFEEYHRVYATLNRRPIGGPWPETAATYARTRRAFITPSWPELPQRRPNRARNSPVPPHGESLTSLLATP